jgi:palmitoyltransferase
MMREAQSNIAATRWTIRIIPFFLAFFFGGATYIVPAYLCVNYLYQEQGQRGTAVVLLVLYFLLFGLMGATYLRLFYTTQYNAALVPLRADREPTKTASKGRRTRGRERGRDVEAPPYVPPDDNPDSPGLEAFYSKRVFVCEADGRPKWCSNCRQWKPDRVSHSHELERCVHKMDHICPWVGGMVSETSFNFFIQFTFYTTLYCIICLSTGAYCLSRQQRDGREIDGRPIAIIAVAAFFGIFTFGMCATSIYFAQTNTTNIDSLKKNQVMHLAIRVPPGTPSTTSYTTISYPLASNAWWPTDGNGRPRGPADPVSPRDEQAISTFAVVRTMAGENPWSLGTWENLKSVLGNNIFEWLLPISHSPCCNHDSMDSAYPMGPLIDELRKRYSLPDDPTKTGHGIEMHTRSHGQHDQGHVASGSRS